MVSLGRKVAKGAALLLASKVAGQILGLASTIIVARFLLPDDYGVFAAAMSLMVLISLFVEFPVSQAIIHLQEADEDDYDTAFTINLLRSAVVALLLLALALPMANFLKEPRVGPVIAALAGYTILFGLKNPRMEWFVRKMDFSREASLEVVSKLAQLVFSAGFAVVLHSYWALLIGITVAGAIQVVLSYIMRPVMPRFTLKSFKRLFNYSIWMAGNTILGQVYQLIDTLTLGRVTGAASLGAYSMGSLLSGRIVEAIWMPASRSLFAAFSQIQNDQKRLANACFNSVSLMAFFLVPVAIIMFIFAEPIVFILLGNQWDIAVPVMQVMAAISLVFIIWTPLQAALMGTGRTRTLFVRALAFLVVYFPLAVWSVMQGGLMGLMVSKLVFVGLFTFVDFTLFRQIIGLSYVRQAAAVFRPAIGGISMVIVFALLDHLIPKATTLLGVGVPLAMLCIFGLLIYLMVVLGAWMLSGRPDGVEQRCSNLLLKAAATVRARTVKT